MKKADTPSGLPDIVPQDAHLAHNQDGRIRCGDNGIFKGGAPSGKVDSVQMLLCALMLYDMSEGKISK